MFRQFTLILQFRDSGNQRGGIVLIRGVGAVDIENESLSLNLCSYSHLIVL